MGCSGSKTAKYAVAQAEAPSAAERAPAEVQPPVQIPEGDFKIKLRNAFSCEELGVTGNCPEKKYIVVTRIKEEGLIPSWNMATENTPEMKMNVGDLIVVVNGVFGNSDLMMAELRAKSITLTVKRGQPAFAAPVAEIIAAAAPAADAPAAEVPSEAPAARLPGAKVAPATTEAAVEDDMPMAGTPSIGGLLDSDVDIVAECCDISLDSKEEQLCKLAMCHT